jgi:hypothetical protein
VLEGGVLSPGNRHNLLLFADFVSYDTKPYKKKAGQVGNSLPASWISQPLLPNVFLCLLFYFQSFLGFGSLPAGGAGMAFSV